MRVFSALLSATALLPLLTQAAFHSNDTACTRHYTVVAGDTCDKIGQKTLTSTYQILAFNLLDAGADCYTLEIGKQLCLGRYGNDCQFVHQCTNQDTCESIANAYGITTQRLQSNNPSLDCDVVYDGLMLCVSAGSIRPPADKSLNSTDVKAAREQARQMWLAKERSKQSNVQVPSSNNKKHASHSKEKHHQHQHSEKGGKPSPQPHKHHAAPAAGDSKLPHPVAEEKAASHHHRAVEYDTWSSETVSRSSTSYSSDEHSIDDLFTAANHTPQIEPPLAGSSTTNAPQKRHRTLSSRSHHHRSNLP